MALTTKTLQGSGAGTDDQLVAEVRAGSDRAFEELYARYRPAIGGYVMSMTGDHQRAEDIAQDVFMSALRRLRETDHPIAFRPWIYAIAKNACIDELRRSHRRLEVPLESGDDAPTPRRLVAHDVDAAVEHRQRLRDLRGAFHGLSEKHHRIIVMRELEGLSYSQIAERLGMSRPMVQSTLFRARRRLTEEYHALASGKRCAQVQGVIAEGDRPLRAMGIRTRRQVAHHLSSCQSCRRFARDAGVDEKYFRVPSFGEKLAALLPLGWLRFRRTQPREAAEESASVGGAHLAPLQSLTKFAPMVVPGGPASGLGRAFATAGAIVAAGAGGGLIISNGSGHMPLPQPAGATARAASAGSGHGPAGSQAGGTAGGARLVSGVAGSGAAGAQAGQLPSGSGPGSSLTLGTGNSGTIALTGPGAVGNAGGGGASATASAARGAGSAAGAALSGVNPATGQPLNPAAGVANQVPVVGQGGAPAGGGPALPNPKVPQVSVPKTTGVGVPKTTGVGVPKTPGGVGSGKTPGGVGVPKTPGGVGLGKTPGGVGVPKTPGGVGLGKTPGGVGVPKGVGVPNTPGVGGPKTPPGGGGSALGVGKPKGPPVSVPKPPKAPPKVGNPAGGSLPKGQGPQTPQPPTGQVPTTPNAGNLVPGGGSGSP
ncbi:MAG: RNA polymerase sigma factor [Solirubrobacterales bacterium]|nr:RNA polymerase sigma factor [Solirubrobacterales bacterium]